MEVMQVLGVVNLILSAATFAVLLKIFYKMEHGDSEKENLPPQEETEQKLYEIPPKAMPVEKRKPIVMDDERAYQLERDEISTRGKPKN